MKKKIFSLAIAAIAALGVTAAAQSKDSRACENTDTCCAQSKDRADKMARPHRFTDFAFEGILLDIPQQARMDSLNAAVKSRVDKAREEKPDRKDGDRGPRRPGMNRGISRDYVAKVKEILTPEQYTVFLENIVFMPENAAAQRPDKGMRQDRGRRPGMDKVRPEKGGKDKVRPGKGNAEKGRPEKSGN
ncbi:MAG: hypothetical protein NC102_04640 [Clostridium sp.]|nr:hypothetical protein [Clostridium sp.]